MIENRLTGYFAESAAVATAAMSFAAFVPCPVSMFVGYPAGHLAYVAEVYRIAREMTEAQLRPTSTRTRMPAFSLN